MSVNLLGHTSTLELWHAGARQDTWVHTADGMIVVVEGRITVQLYNEVNEDGERHLTVASVNIYNTGETAYVPANQIFSVTYETDCKIVRVHDGEVEFRNV